MTTFSFPGSRQERPEDALESEAIEWILKLEEDSSAEADCAAWRAADPEHEKAFTEAMSVWNQTAALGALEREDWRAEIDSLTHHSPFKRRAQLGFAIAASLVAALFIGWFVNLPDASYRTAVAETQEVALQDGSHLTVGAQSDVELHFADDERRVVLNGGQAFFQVAHDTSRPFTVIAGNAEVRVTGTKFDVRRSGGAVWVSVLEGRVEVRRHRMLPMLDSDAPALVLTAGLKTSLPAGAETFSPPEDALIPAGDWRSGRFFYRDATLSEIVSDLRRYSAVPIQIPDPAVGRLKITTSFQAGETEQFLDNLSTILPVVKRRERDGTITLEARPSVE